MDTVLGIMTPLIIFSDNMMQLIEVSRGSKNTKQAQIRLLINLLLLREQETPYSSDGTKTTEQSFTSHSLEKSIMSQAPKTAVDQTKEQVANKDSKKKRWSFARNRSSFATVLSQESDTNEDWSEDRPSNPYANASLLSKAFFVWPYELMKTKKSVEGQDAAAGILQEKDLPTLLAADSSGENLFKFNVMWMAEKRRAEEAMEKFNSQSEKGKIPCIAPKPAYPSLKRAIVKDYISSLWFVQPIMLILSAAKLLQAVSLGRLLQSFENDGGDGSYMWAGLLVLSAVMVLMTNHQVYFFTWKKGYV